MPQRRRQASHCGAPLRWITEHSTSRVSGDGISVAGQPTTWSLERVDWREWTDGLLAMLSGYRFLHRNKFSNAPSNSGLALVVSTV